MPARATCGREHSAALGRPFLPVRHCCRGRCWQPQARAPWALLLSIHSQHSRAPPARDLGTMLPCRKAPSSTAGPPYSAVSHRHQPLATGKRGRKPQQAPLFCQLQLLHQLITLSLTVPIWFVRHSFPYSLLYLAHSWSATCSRKETLGMCTPLLSPSTHCTSAVAPRATHSPLPRSPSFLPLSAPAEQP